MKTVALASHTVHKVADAHPTAPRAVPGSSAVEVHAEAPPVGLVDVNRLPLTSTARHKVTVGRSVHGHLGL